MHLGLLQRFCKTLYTVIDCLVLYAEESWEDVCSLSGDYYSSHTI
jgi:hypothetical protein